jgi:hypothetical protein
MAKKLIDKHLEFCEQYVANGFNAAKAYAQIYGTSKKSSAIQGWKLLQQKKIQDQVAIIEGTYLDLGRKVGINKEKILEKVKELLEAKKGIYFQGTKTGEEPDWVAVANGIEKFAKLTGAFEADKKKITIDDEREYVDLEKMSEEEKKNLRDKILNEL